MTRDGIEYFVSLTEQGEVIVRCGETNSTTVNIPIDILFKLTKLMLANGVAQDYISEDILSDIHGLL